MKFAPNSSGFLQMVYIPTHKQKTSMMKINLKLALIGIKGKNKMNKIKNLVCA